MSHPDQHAESKKNHLWRRIVWHTDPELHPLGPHHSAEVYCCEESNGYSVWYVRKMPHAERRAAGASGAAGAGATGVENGDYLLAYYGRDRRDDAITRAVQIATGAAGPEAQIAALDELASKVPKL